MQVNNNGINNNKLYTNYNQEINNINNKSKNNDISIKNNYKDKLDLSKDMRMAASRSRAIMGPQLDKGTASNTTIYVDKSTFMQITNYSTNNSECQWDELGIDGEKRWVVINGQRFECPLSKEEKEAIKRASKTMLDYLIEADEEKEEKEEKKENIDFKFNGDGSISIDDESLLSSNPKLSGLLKNDKVMKMLKDIAKSNGGSLSMHI
ncbi:hypothetical protein FDE76_00870 [Clostridium botulinum]|uniref:Uncharacterized protein n=1 Tax=Clostridium botulinum (strain Eklund 17B / Type B) TaxID=935198 RepID=B2TQD0_CLOBB|nr:MULTISPECIES: hypothetical protein [unclassified Clostridium]ACD22944.1 conserved hypothetical protein [Clostridium botulinum B str. Eklund 17B (NRP)]MBN1053324.1 hypothetical protein [Clostridium botulinum]MBN1056521.1 hypothetical protein [Clostridium botulinum]MBY6975567.1 hypothetical protein [Clostridium botulinum]MBY7001116.1 hypothetical protein [Clostridium botulinum]